MTDLLAPPRLLAPPVPARPRPRFATAVFGPTAATIAVIVACATVRSGWAMTAATVVGLLVLPGAALLALAGLRPAAPSVRAATAVVTSAGLLMIVGLALSIVGPPLGVARPLSRVWVGGTVLVLVVAGTVVSTLRGREPLRYLWGDVRVSPATPVVAALPLAAALGAGRLNAGHGPTVAIVASAVAIATVVGTFVWSWRGRIRTEHVAVVLFAVTLAFAWATSLRGGHLYGWDIQQEHGSVRATLTAGRWTRPASDDAYGAMASITVLPAVLSVVSGLAANDVLRWVFPVFLALVPVATWALARRRVRPAAALGATLLLVVLQAPTLRSFPAITRQEVGLAIFAVGLAVAFDDAVDLRRRRVALATAAALLAFSHYSSAYVACIVLAGTWLGSRLLGGRRVGATRVVNVAVVAVALAASLGWNMAVTGTGGNLSRIGDGLSANGVAFLPAASGSGLLGGWLQATSSSPIDARAYQGIVDQRLAGSLTWITPDPRATDPAFTIATASAPTQRGLLPALDRAVPSTITVAAQAVILLSICSVLAAAFVALRRRRRRTPAATDLVELAAAGLAMLVVVGALRNSGTLAEMYNPERAAVQAGIVFAPLAAIVLDRLVARARRLVLPVAAATVIVAAASASGWSSVVVDGGRPGSLSAVGEDAERFAVSPAEIGTIAWIAAHVPDHSIVQADRYGKITLLDVQQQKSFALVDLVVPDAIDRAAWVYGSSSNVVLGRARGQEGRHTALFSWPADYLDTTKSTVYSTGVTDVHR